ncbi:pyruvate dehydrogenase protein X component, mitochondrial-like [Tachypleus tridentatus]|uniref:pyruvate dehydrogenase protein X component, mitochondrial-like n=1 Tax=Tachypleus tridentatus TaxID=6853 RepID=UPI003FCFF02A
MAAVLASKLVINSLTPKYFGICRTLRSVEWRLSPFTFSKHWIHRNFPCLGVKGLQIKMPSLSPTMTEGTIIKWMKTEGDSVMAGDLICEIQTDKAVVGYEVDEDGILAKILVPADTKDIKVGTCIALMVGEGEDWKDVEIPDGGTQDTSSTSETTTPVIKTEPEPPRKPETSERVSKFSMVGPAVRGLLELYGLESSQIPPSGPHNNLIKGDVLEYIKKQNLKPKAPKETSPIVKGTLPPQKMMVPSSRKEEEYVDIPLTDSKSTIANAFAWSKDGWPLERVTFGCNGGSIFKCVLESIINDKVEMNFSESEITGRFRSDYATTRKGFLFVVTQVECSQETLFVNKSDVENSSESDSNKYKILTEINTTST